MESVEGCSFNPGKLLVRIIFSDGPASHTPKGHNDALCGINIKTSCRDLG